jgi:hypothetical protein
MQIVDAYECSVHTHYLTDGERMRAADVQAVERAMSELLAALGIVYPLRVRPDKERGRIHLLLECRPIKADAERVRKRLAELLAPLPIRPVTTVKIEGSEAPPTGRPARADRPAPCSRPPAWHVEPP